MAGSFRGREKNQREKQKIFCKNNKVFREKPCLKGGIVVKYFSIRLFGKNGWSAALITEARQEHLCREEGLGWI